MSQPEDGLLPDRLTAATPAAIAEYIEQHRERLLAYIDSQLGAALRAKVEPEDLLQDVCADACRSVHEVRLEDCSPMGWLCQVAQRRIVDAHRRHFGAQKRAAGREVPLGAPGGDTQHVAIIDLLTASLTTASQAFSRNEKEIRLLEALSTLPPEQRQAVELRYGQGLPTKDIARRIGKSDGAVRVMLTRALAMLRERLGTEG